MKLFLIYQHVNNDYDTYDSAVVAAEDKKDAKTIHPRGDGLSIVNNDDKGFNSWCKLKEVNVKYIGEAAEKIKRGVICASFNAG